MFANPATIYKSGKEKVKMRNNLSRQQGSFYEKMKKRVNVFISDARRDRKGFILKLTKVCCIPLLAVSAVSYIALMNSADVNLSVYADGKYIGTVENISLAKQAILEAGADISDTVQVKSEDSCKITYSFTRKKSDSENIMSKDALSDALYEAELDRYVSACGLFVDGEYLTSGKDGQTVNTLIEKVEQAVDSGSAKLMSELSAKNVYVPHNEIYSGDEIISTLILNLKYDNSALDSELGNDILFSYAQDDDISYAPNMNGQTNEIAKSDSENTETDFKGIAKSYETSESEIPFKTVYIESDEVLIGTYKLQTEGESGTVQTLYELISVNGSVITKTEVSTTVTKEAVDKVVLKGTKPKATGVTTGVFANPMSGEDFVYTDMYGNRILNGSHDFHMGVDFSADAGTPIHAADGGKVTVAGWNGSYGLCVIVKHSNGYETLYAHMSKVSVSVGDAVEKGDVLGKVGQTGKAYGEHLHFEIMIGKQRFNPMDFIPKY